MSAPTCPKAMEYGPCGGVEQDGRCEVASHPCVFLERPARAWAGIDGATRPPAPTAPTEQAERMRARIARAPIVVADFPARALDVGSIRDCAEALGGAVDAVLAGDSGSARVQFPPSLRTSLIRGAGLPVWSGVNNRDRNRVALEGELAGLAVAGASGVHCVTGDHTAIGDRPDAAPVFDLDSTETAALARSLGHLVSVGESPATPPRDRRAARLLQKERAGAEICFVNHCGGPQEVARFVAEARGVGVGMGFVPCVPVVIDRRSAALIRSFTSLVLPEGFVERIEAAADPRAAGIDAAVRMSERMLGIDGVVGVDLSGGRDGGERDLAEALGQIAERLSPGAR